MTYLNDQLRKKEQLEGNLRKQLAEMEQQLTNLRGQVQERNEVLRDVTQQIKDCPRAATTKRGRNCQFTESSYCLKETTGGKRPGNK